MSATEARKNLRGVLTDVADNGSVVIVERYGKPHAVFLSIEEYERLSTSGQRTSMSDMESNADIPWETHNP